MQIQPGTESFDSTSFDSTTYTQRWHRSGEMYEKEDGTEMG